MYRTGRNDVSLLNVSLSYTK